jgi:hypothetical protein
MLSWASFSLACALHSAASAEAFASLFGRFIGTMAQSALPQNVHARMMVLSPSRTGLLAQTALKFSRFSCTLFPDMPRLFDYAEPNGHSRIAQLAGVAFPLTERGGSRLQILGAQSSRSPVPLSMLRYDSSRSHRQDSRLGWSRFCFPVGGLASPTMCRSIPALSVHEIFQYVETCRCKDHQ